MRNKFLHALILFCLLSLSNKITASGIGDRLSVKSGLSYSLTQVEFSPFSELRRWYDRGVLSPFLNFQYSYPTKNQNEFTVGFQMIQKGFKAYLHFDNKKNFEFTQSYEYLLNYIELPICFKYNGDKYKLITGCFFSYLYDDTYRFSETQILKNRSPLVYNEIKFAGQYPHPERFRELDFGINLGITRSLTSNIDLELTYQRGIIKVDKRNTLDLAYNMTICLGVRYAFATR
jgi:hypothetical protein